MSDVSEGVAALVLDEVKVGKGETCFGVVANDVSSDWRWCVAAGGDLAWVWEEASGVLQ